jgi:hypothetical protein
MAGIPTARFDVANLDQWGKLVKSWATHLNYVDQPYSQQPPRDTWVNTTWPNETGRKPAPATVPDTDASGPKPWALPAMTPVDVPRPDGTSVALPGAVALTADEFKSRLAKASVVITTMPIQYSHVVIVQGSIDTMVIRLPPKDTLQGSEDDLLNGLPYAFRSFYTTAFGTNPTLPTAQDGVMTLHANRIGEYTLNNCI